MGISKTKYQKQVCVYWAPGHTESAARSWDVYGQPIYADPVEKYCRWDDIAEIFVRADGTQETSKAIVFVDDVLQGGLLLLGELTSALNLVDPRSNEGAWEIKKVETIPNRTASVNYTWAYL